ncbi:MAG: hypothetical protein JSV09_07195 [Thermoplasmata archaeon]|nr:MAG: hypothetical protein JSV09_07195 [Thermoplasmata archaeon]
MMRKKLIVIVLSALLLLNTIQFITKVESGTNFEYYGYIHKINATTTTELSNYNISLTIGPTEIYLTTDSYGFYYTTCSQSLPHTVNYTVEWTDADLGTTTTGYYEFVQTVPVDRRIDPTFIVNNNLWEWFNDPIPPSYSASPHSDIKVVDIRFSNDNPNERDNITIYADIKNRGESGIVGSNITVSFYNDTEFIQNGTIAGLDENETKNTSVSWNNLAAGYHTITVKVDLSNVYLEMREQWNNNRTEDIDVWRWISGDWNITSSENYSDIPYVVDGDLNIKSGANSTLDNCKLKIKSSYDGEHKIEVMSGGYLNLSDSSVTPYNITFPYNFDVYGSMKISGSHIGFLSGNLSTGVGGVKIYSDNVSILDSLIHDSKSSGLYIFNVDPLVENSNIISNAGNGIYLDGSDATLKNIQLFGNYNYGILFNNSNSKLDKAYVHSFKSSLYLRGASNTTITNSTFAGNNNSTVNLTEDSHAIFINTSLNSGKIGFEDNLSSIIIGWYLDIQAIDSGSPLNNASIQVRDIYGNLIANTTTDSGGIVKWITAFDVEHNSTNRTYFSPYTIDLSYQSANTSRMIWMDHSKTINVTSNENETWSTVFIKLETESVVRPNLLNFTTDFPSGNFTTLDCENDRYLSSFDNITITYSSIVSYIENKSGVPLLLNGSGIILASMKHKDVGNLSSYNGVEKVEEFNRTDMYPDTSFNLTNLKNKIETINSTYYSFNTTDVINVTYLNITSSIENLTAIAEGLEDIPISNSTTNISLLHSDFESYLDSIQDYMDNMNTSTQYLTVCGMAVTKVNLDALYKYMGLSTFEMHSIRGGIREVQDGLESLTLNTMTMDETMGPLDYGNYNGVPFSMTYHYRGFSEELWEFDIKQMISMGMNWVRMDVEYDHLDYVNKIPKQKLDDFIHTIDDVNEEYDIDFKIFMVLKPVNEITKSNADQAKNRIINMIDVINDYQLSEDETYFRDMVYAYQIMNEPPKKTWTEVTTIEKDTAPFFYIVILSYTTEKWMETVVDAAKNKIQSDGMSHYITVNLAYPRGSLFLYRPFGTIYANLGDLVTIPSNILDPVLNTIGNPGIDTIGVWFEPFWGPLASHVDFLGVDIYPEDMIFSNYIKEDPGLLEAFVKTLLSATADVKDFWICETPAIDLKWMKLGYARPTPEDIYNYIKWEVDSGAKAISLYQYRDSGGSDLIGEEWAYGLFHKDSKEGHVEYIEEIRIAAYEFGDPFVSNMDQVQATRTGSIYIGGYNRFYQTFTSGKSGSTKYIDLYITIPPNARMYLWLEAYYPGPDDKIDLGYSVYWHTGADYLNGWVKFEFGNTYFPTGTKFKMIGHADDIEDEVQPPFLPEIEIFVGDSTPDPGGPYPNGELGTLRGNKPTPMPNLDATFRTFVE